ncbi:MAG TPA: hypothetical protein VKY85_06935 [Candidatus Angelobacter sp.]|nr:hypothetical protein [Candidatus Angelobacter sp.]
MRYLILIWALLACRVATAAPPEEKFLCQKDEQVVFGCNLGNKIVSLCASSGPSPRFQYRAGSSKHMELQFPSVPGPAQDNFWFSSTAFSGGGSAHIRFKIADYEYLLFDYTMRTGFGADGHNNPEFGAGVAVLRGGNVISTQSCKNDASIQSLAYDQLPKEEYTSYKRIPE